MLIALTAVVAGLALLAWSADRFVDGASATAAYAGMPPLLIGMVVVGFGTSAPEMVVSALAASQGNPGLALGNAYGSNIANIALILGLTAVICPINIHSGIARKELPMLAIITGLAGYQLLDGQISRLDALVLLAAFFLIMGGGVLHALRQPRDPLGSQVRKELREQALSLRQALFWLTVGLLLLVASSRILVWGAVQVAQGLGVSDLVIGLTIVAVGTSLPELASSLVAVRKGEHDMAIGNILGSNLFNTLAVVGIAGAIEPMRVARDVLYRDWTVMSVLTAVLFVISYGFRGPARLNRLEGSLLLAAYITYNTFLAMQQVMAH